MTLPYELYSQQRIVNHLENHSPTKFMYSFSRAQRFPSLDRRGFSDSIYDFRVQEKQVEKLEQVMALNMILQKVV